RHSPAAPHAPPRLSGGQGRARRVGVPRADRRLGPVVASGRRDERRERGSEFDRPARRRRLAPAYAALGAVATHRDPSTGPGGAGLGEVSVPGALARLRLPPVAVAPSTAGALSRSSGHADDGGRAARARPPSGRRPSPRAARRTTRTRASPPR